MDPPVPRVRSSIVPGFEFSGTVAAVQPGVDLRPGERVFGVTLFGGYSSRVTVPCNQVCACTLRRWAKLWRLAALRSPWEVVCA
jgi:NADPH:quinone reductase-like Zn-dependent oxidoreductase